MGYVLLLSILIGYSAVRWIVINLSGFICMGAGAWVMRDIDKTSGALLVLGGAFILLLQFDRRRGVLGYGITGGTKPQSAGTQTRPKETD